ncbi:MAG TPA: LuxR C-terminal-related transcriptional regulator [Allocoleopsis sp.]
MSSLAPNSNSNIQPFEKPTHSEKHLKLAPAKQSKPPSLLKAIIEGFVDGVLIMTEQGECIHANEFGRKICHQFSQGNSQSHSIPQSIWNVCESLIDSRELFPEQKMIIEATIELSDLATFRVRVRWLELAENDTSYLLVTIEDRNQSTHNAAIADAKRYGLTPREAEVWLLRRANYSYKEIAAKLYITLNTVKKHMKSVYAKQQENLWEDEEQKAS